MENSSSDLDPARKNTNPPSHQNVTQRPRLWTATFVIITAIALCAFLVGQGMNAGTSVYINRLGGSATLAGIGAAVFSGAALAARLISGPLADSHGRFIVLVLGAITLFAGVVGSAISASMDLFILWRIIQGLGFSAVTTAAATAAADVLPLERLGEGIGYYGLGQAVAISVGPAVAIALVSTDPPENLYWGVGAIAAIAIVLCVACSYERHPERLPQSAAYLTMLKKKQAAKEKPDKKPVSFKSKVFERGALAGGIPMMVLAPAFGFGIFFAGLLGTELGVEGAGLFYSVSAITMIVIRLSSKSFMDRVASIRLFAIAVLAGVVCFGTLAFVTAVDLSPVLRSGLFYAAGLPYGLCLGLALPVNQAVSVKNSPTERWGAANGLFYLLYDVGIGIASLAWGVINDQYGFTVTLCCVVVLALLSLAVAHLTYPDTEKRKSTH